MQAFNHRRGLPVVTSLALQLRQLWLSTMTRLSLPWAPLRLQDPLAAMEREVMATRKALYLHLRLWLMLFA